jgi:hypothetical protein
MNTTAIKAPAINTSTGTPMSSITPVSGKATGVAVGVEVGSDGGSGVFVGVEVEVGVLVEVGAGVSVAVGSTCWISTVALGTPAKAVSVAILSRSAL